MRVFGLGWLIVLLLSAAHFWKSGHARLIRGCFSFSQCFLLSLPAPSPLPLTHPISSSRRDVSTWHFREQIARSKKTPALQATAIWNPTMFQTIFMCSLDDNVFSPLSPNSDQDQFSLNNIHTLSRDLVMRIYEMNTYCFALIFYQILSTHSLRKYIKISLENLYVDIMATYCIFTYF